MELQEAKIPTMYFIGVTTGKSSSARVFPRWAQLLDLGPCRLVGLDFPLHDDPQRYRKAVKFIKSANGDWKPKNRDWKPKPLPTLPNMNFDAETETGEFDETRAARLVKMMEESPEIENPTFVSSIRAVIGALVR